ncbi:MAG: DNA-binding response regulator [Planctomycetaceae bacterium]|nr:DNA-binding response regulator [Planctomycetaceae bacterium]
MAKQTILIIEDEPSLIEVLAYNLEKEGFEILTATDGREGLDRARTAVPDLVILDLMLPSVDGLQVCAQLRSNPVTHGIRILMLTARAEETDEVVGFSMGADDYVTKPFKVRPLIHRIKALMRRSEKGKFETSVISAHGIEMDRVNYITRVDGTEVELTPTEFRLLWTIMRQPGRPFSRLELMDSSRGMDANALERTIDVHVRSLRKKLGEASQWIETVRGIGYRFKRS